MVDRKILVKNHDGKLRQLLKIYNVKGDLYKGKLLRYSLISNLLITVVICLTTEDFYTIIVKFLDFYIGALPSLLGFNLGAYALLIGLGSSKLIEKLSSNFKTKFTTFQRASSVFGFCVLLQVISFIIASGYKVIVIIEDSAGNNIPDFFYNPFFATPLNVIGLFLLNLFGVYSILILLSVIESIFAISQASHFYSITKQLKEEKEAKTRNVKFLSYVRDGVLVHSDIEIEGEFLEWGVASIYHNNAYVQQSIAVVKCGKSIYQALPSSLVFI